MSCDRNLCYASCPPMTVTIQPPPFTLTIPGPALYCPDQPLCIEQYNPCAPACQAITSGGYGSFSPRGISSSKVTGIYSQKFMQRSRGDCRSFYRC